MYFWSSVHLGLVMVHMVCMRESDLDLAKQVFILFQLALSYGWIHPHVGFILFQFHRTARSWKLCNVLRAL